jgi:LPS sulfotransferase NodH
MIMRNPIRRNYYKTTGGLRSMDTGFDRWRGDASRNPALLKATDDDMWIEESRRKIELANKLMARENAKKNKSEADMLEYALNSGNSNLYGEPENEQDEELQKLMQEHVDAGMRGLEWQWSPKALDRQRKMAFENHALNARLRDQALDESKFIDQKRRDARGYALDVNKAMQNDAYRENLLAQRQKQMQYDALMDMHKNSSAEAKQALDLVKEGMDPEEVISLFRLNPRDQQLLRSYRGAVDQEESLEMDPMIDYLNERELSMRRGVTPQEEGPGFIDGVRTFFGGRSAPLPLPADRVGRGGLAPAEGDEFEKLRLEAAQAGLQYDPRQRGFYSDRPQYQPPAPPQAPNPGLASIPLITTQEEWMRLPKGAPYRTMSGKVKRKT